MKTNHQNKKFNSVQILFLAVGIAISILAVFSICVTQKALAEDVSQETNDGKFTFTWDYEGESESFDVGYTVRGEPMGTYQVNKGVDLNAIAKEDIGDRITSLIHTSTSKSITLYISTTGVHRFAINGATLPVNGYWYFDGNILTEYDSITVNNQDHVLYFTDKAPVVSCNINGIVSDADSLNPIAGASVVYTSSSASNYTVSDTTKDDGSYSLTIEDDNYLPGKLVVKADGYDEYTKNISKEDFVEGKYELPISITKTATPDPQPQPQPQPELQSAANNSVAQTGDSLEFTMILLAIITLMCGAYVVRKQLIK